MANRLRGPLPKYGRTLALAALLVAALPGAAKAVVFGFDDLPFLYNAPAAFPPINFNGGAEVTTQSARSAPHALMLYGEDLSPSMSYGYFAPYTNLNIPVTDRTRLEYYVMPLWGSTSFAVDLKFSDGSYLRSYPAQDQYGIPLHAAYQGGGGHLSMNQYNRVESNIGLWVAGKTITQIIVAWDRYPGTGWQNALFDDISLTETLDCANAGVGCGTTVCRSACSEVGLRDAVSRANACQGNAQYQRRTIVFAPTCTSISMVTNFDNDPAYTLAPDPALDVANCPLESASQPFRHSICLTANDLTIDGTIGAGNVLLTYNRLKNVQKLCRADLDSAGPPPFVMRGNRGWLRRFTTEYFDEGIVARAGDGNVLDRITSTKFCDEAITIGGPSTTPTNTVVRDVNLTGFTCDAQCGTRNGTGPCSSVPAPNNLRTCGFDKAIQVLSGTGTKILDSDFNQTGKAVLVKRGDIVIEDNVLTGHPTMDVSDSITVDGELLAPTETVFASINYNTFTKQKFGIRAENGGFVSANNNILKDCYSNAFSARNAKDGRPSKIRAAGNRIKNCGGSQGCNRGAVGGWNDPTAEVDFGGGHCGVGGTLGGELIPGLGASPGGNVFCQSTTAIDFYRRTHGDLSASTPACTGTLGNMCVRAQSNCFSDGDADNTPINGIDVAGLTSSCDCNF